MASGIVGGVQVVKLLKPLQKDPVFFGLFFPTDAAGQHEGREQDHDHRGQRENCENG